jgi:hypothetical protein
MLLLVCGLAGLAEPARAQGPAAVLTDAQVNADIATMRKSLYSQQNAQGSWEEVNANAPGATTALVTLALLVSGESEQRPEIGRALAFLRSKDVQTDKIKGPDGKDQYKTTIYKASLLAQVWAHLPESYNPLLTAQASWIESACHNGAWHYYPNQLDFDHSTTQYGVLGLWEAAQRGVHIRYSSELWGSVIAHFKKTQLPHGGWAYAVKPGDADAAAAATQSMTCAGLTSLLVAQQEMMRERFSASGDVAKMVQKGLAWMDQYFDPTTNPGEEKGQNKGGFPAYSLYCVERVALASGVKNLHSQDWYRAGAQYIHSRLQPPAGGPDLGDTCFFLMFLSRGRVPVWVTKLQVTDKPAVWNNRPNDIYFLTHFLSDARESEVNWQVLDLSAPAEELRTAPVLYYSSGQGLTLSSEQTQTLKRYLDLGGLLWINPEGGSDSPLAASVRNLVKTMYPDLVLRALPAEHPIYKADYDLKAAEFPVEALSNGDRELIVMPLRDMGADYQHATPASAEQSPSHEFAINLFTYACDRGHIQPRLTPRFEVRQGGEAKDKMEVGRPRYGAATWLTEPLAWEPAATRAFNRGAINVTVSSDDPVAALRLDALGDCDDKLVWLTGVDKYALTDTEKESISLYVRRGGTLLIENIGARGGLVGGAGAAFTDSLRPDLKAIFGAEPKLFTAACPGHAILTGKGVPGLYDITRVNYRRAAAWVLKTVGFQPQLEVYLVAGRPAVFVTSRDLSLGLLDVRRWGIDGYSSEASRQMLCNLILWANTQQLVAADAAVPPPADTQPAPAPATAPAPQ